MEIRRDFYLNKLISRKHNGLIKIITGIRRCGKSYLLNNIFYNHLLESGVPSNHIIRFSFDSADDLDLINGRELDPDIIYGVYEKEFADFFLNKCCKII